jgi:sialate O-acetylesterase
MKTLFKITLLITAISTLMSCNKETNLSVPSIFSDNMVIQQNKSVAIWGKATPGTEITISGSWEKSATATAGDDSTWQTELSTIEAGGPYELSVSSSDTTITIKNVMLGEVWLASGQSNMEMPLKGWPPNDTILNSAQFITNSDNEAIRMFTVARNMASEPLDNVSGAWVQANPENSGNFSATAYFFARKLNKELNVPIGIIHSSWGGTPIEAWISSTQLKESEDFSDIIKDLEKLAPQAEAYDRWLATNESVSILPTAGNKEPYKDLDAFDEFCSDPATNTANWPSVKLPTTIEQTEIGEMDGIVWFRKDIEIPESWEGQELILSLGPIDDMDVTYLNGEKIGGTEVEGFWQQVRYYTIPAEMAKQGSATIAVKVMDHQGGGGIYGDPDQMKIHPKGNDANAIALDGEWKYNVVGQIAGSKLYLFDPSTDAYESRPELSVQLSSHTPTVLYNAMIAPLVPYTINGTIWYQGETNVGRANQYMELKSALINNWRRDFKNPEMPFYYVQLAPWNYNDVEGISSANLREAQRRSLKIPNTGMAVTLDIGNVNNIHPANKTDVGERLALWALTKDYEKNIPFSGPIPDDLKAQEGKIIITFTNVSDGLKINSDVPNQFEIAGNDGKFFPANATVKEEQVIVSSPKVNQPVNVRYAYKNGAEASLFNGAGLPAPSFTSEETIND